MKSPIFGWKIPKKYIAFFSIVPLMLASAFIKLPCPVCEGTGTISSWGMSGVTIQHIDYSLNSQGAEDACLTYQSYTFVLTLTLYNNGIQDAQGYVMLGLVDVDNNMIIGKAPAAIQVKSKQTIQNVDTATFYLSETLPTNISIAVQPLSDAAKCTICGGSGKLTLNQWILAKFQPEQLVKLQQVAPVVIMPDPVWPETYMGQEYVTNDWQTIIPEEYWNQ
jgi:hypothetical protein